MTARLTKGMHWSLKGDAPAIRDFQTPMSPLIERKFGVKPLDRTSSSRKCSPRNFVELLDLINQTEYFGAAHCFDVINDAL